MFGFRINPIGGQLSLKYTTKPNETIEDVSTRILQTEKLRNRLWEIRRTIKNRSFYMRIPVEVEHQKEQWTFETIRNLIHENMHDRLSDCNDSNDSRSVIHVQEKKPNRSIWSKNTS